MKTLLLQQYHMHLRNLCLKSTWVTFSYFLNTFWLFSFSLSYNILRRNFSCEMDSAGVHGGNSCELYRVEMKSALGRWVFVEPQSATDGQTDRQLFACLSVCLSSILITEDGQHPTRRSLVASTPRAPPPPTNKFGRVSAGTVLNNPSRFGRFRWTRPDTLWSR